MIKTTTQFPVNPGTVVEVTCSDSEHVNKGSSRITCITGSIFAFSEEPICSLPGFDVKFHKTTTLVLVNLVVVNKYVNCQFSNFHHNIINFLFVLCGCSFIVLLCLM